MTGIKIIYLFFDQRNQKGLLWKAIKINNKIGIDSNSHDIHFNEI